LPHHLWGGWCRHGRCRRLEHRYHCRGHALGRHRCCRRRGRRLLRDHHGRRRCRLGLRWRVHAPSIFPKTTSLVLGQKDKLPRICGRGYTSPPFHTCVAVLARRLPSGRLPLPYHHGPPCGLRRVVARVCPSLEETLVQRLPCRRRGRAQGHQPRHSAWGVPLRGQRRLRPAVPLTGSAPYRRGSSDPPGHSRSISALSVRRRGVLAACWPVALGRPLPACPSASLCC
jgi:hypothetical protein